MLENICWYGTTFSLTVTPLCSDSNFLTSSVKEVSSDLLAQVVNVSEPESPPPLPLPPPKPEQPLRVSAGARAIPMRAADLFLLGSPESPPEQETHPSATTAPPPSRVRSLPSKEHTYEQNRRRCRHPR